MRGHRTPFAILQDAAYTVRFEQSAQGPDMIASVAAVGNVG